MTGVGHLYCAGCGCDLGLNGKEYDTHNDFCPDCEAKGGGPGIAERIKEEIRQEKEKRRKKKRGQDG